MNPISIEFSDEAGDTYQHLIGYLHGLNARITTEDGEVIEAQLCRPAHGDDQWINDLMVRRLDANDEPTGPLVKVRAQSVFIY